MRDDCNQTKVKRGYVFTSEDGSTLLVVVIIMSIVIMMGSIMFNYSLQNLRLMREVGNLEKAYSAAETGLVDTIEGICDRIDQGVEIGDYTQSNNSIFIEDPNYSYQATVSELNYSPSDFVATSNRKSYTIKKGEENLGAGILDAVLYPAIAIESVGMYKTSQAREKILVEIIDTEEEDGYFIVVIYNCYE